MTFSTSSSRPEDPSIGSRPHDPPAIQFKETRNDVVGVKVGGNGNIKASATEVKPWAHLVAGG